MSTSLTRFELLLPQYAANTAGDIAVQQFLAQLNSLTTYFITQTSEVGANNTVTGGAIVWGVLSPTQALTALGYLNTLNTALGTTVPCISWTVVTQPLERPEVWHSPMSRSIPPTPLFRQPT